VTAPRFLPIAIAVVLAAVAAGCGGDPEGAASPDPASPIVVAALGDSITAGSPLWDPDEGIRVAIGAEADERSQYEYWAARVDPRLEFRNCGVIGERTDEIALRLGECAEDADAVVNEGGINDIAQGRPVSEAAVDIRAMVRDAKGMGLAVAVADVLPWNNGHPGADGAIARLNSAIRRIGRSEGVPVLPFHDTLEDPARPGTMKAGWTYEGDHPSVAGYRLLGERAVALPDDAGAG
jgi:lysophospholipase L1-like esterase